MQEPERSGPRGNYLALIAHHFFRATGVLSNLAGVYQSVALYAHETRNCLVTRIDNVASEMRVINGLLRPLRREFQNFVNDVKRNGASAPRFHRPIRNQQCLYLHLLIDPSFQFGENVVQGLHHVTTRETDDKCRVVDH